MSQGKIVGETKLRDDDPRKCDQPGCDRKADRVMERERPGGHVVEVCLCRPCLRLYGNRGH